ncbi:hypothetical protein DL768_007786 [Monosporascus sp. mg162]|nr:hypothetical protein DL768_007786 [Monosporascus sp. mg162]
MLDEASTPIQDKVESHHATHPSPSHGRWGVHRKTLPGQSDGQPTTSKGSTRATSSTSPSSNRPSTTGFSSSATLTHIAVCDVPDFPDFPTAGSVAAMRGSVRKDGRDSCRSDLEGKAYYRRELTIVGDQTFLMLLCGTGLARLWAVASSKEHEDDAVIFLTSVASVAADRPEVTFIAAALESGG